MSTCILDLLDAIDAELARDDRVLVEDASAALQQAHGVLLSLHADGLEACTGGARQAAARGLAVMARTVAGAWPQQPGRLAQLTGVVGDAAGKLRTELTRSDRWAITIRLGPIVRKCALVIERSGPYSHVPELKVIGQSAANLRRLAACDPPDPARCIGIARPIPHTHLIGEPAPAAVVHEAVAGMLDYVRLSGRPPLSLRQAIGVCRAAENLSRATSQLVPQVDASSTWAVAAARFAQFEDGVHGGPGDRLLRHALDVEESLIRIGRDGWGHVNSTDRHLLSEAAGHLPAIADGLHRDLCSRRPSMLVPLAREPLNEDRVDKWLQRQTFMSDRSDLYALHNALTNAGNGVGLHPKLDRRGIVVDL